jgi:thioester reductase-like protein
LQCWLDAVGELKEKKKAQEEEAQGALSAVAGVGHAGDLAKPNLGLTLEVYKELAFNLDTVVHNGALVNHAFTYEQLFEPNVLGSLEVGGTHLTGSTFVAQELRLVLPC